MQVDDATALLLDLLQTLAEKGIVTEGSLTIIRPVQPGLIRPVAYVQDEPIKTIKAVIERTQKPESLPILELDKQQNIALGYTGDICVYCGSSRMKRSGTCCLCETCGQTSGCS